MQPSTPMCPGSAPPRTRRTGKSLWSPRSQTARVVVGDITPWTLRLSSRSTACWRCTPRRPLLSFVGNKQNARWVPRVDLQKQAPADLVADFLDSGESSLTSSIPSRGPYFTMSQPTVAHRGDNFLSFLAYKVYERLGVTKYSGSAYRHNTSGMCGCENAPYRRC